MCHCVPGFYLFNICVPLSSHWKGCSRQGAEVGVRRLVSDGEGGTQRVSCVSFPVQVRAQRSGGLLTGCEKGARCVDMTRGCSSE